MAKEKRAMGTTRRKFSFVAVAASLAVVALSSTQASAASAAQTTITLYSSGDVNVQQLWQTDLVPLFEKSHPRIKVNVIFSEHGTTDTAMLAKLIASVKAKQSFQFDILDSGLVSQASQANLLQKLNAKEIPLISRIDPLLLKQNAYEGLPYRGSSVVLAYNTNEVKHPPKTLAQLVKWIKANPGKFTYNSPNTGGSGAAFVQAMLNQYVPAVDKRFMVSGYKVGLESYWKKGLNELKSLQPDIYRSGFYPNGNTAVVQLVGNSSIWMAPVWSDQALSAFSENILPPSVKLIQLSPPLNGGPADIGVPVNSPHKAQAEVFLNWLLTPKAQSIIIKQMDGFPGVEWKYVDKSIQAKFASIATSYNLGYSTQFGSDVNSVWQSQVASK